MITVACSCGKRLKGPATAVGKKARCAACGGVVVVSLPGKSTGTATVQAAAAAKSKTPVAVAVTPIKPVRPTPAPAPPPPDDDSLGAMYDLAEQANAVPALSNTVCPQCRTPR